jgi:hypothetical protein
MFVYECRGTCMRPQMHSAQKLLNPRCASHPAPPTSLPFLGGIACKFPLPHVDVFTPTIENDVRDEIQNTSGWKC